MLVIPMKTKQNSIKLNKRAASKTVIVVLKFTLINLPNNSTVTVIRWNSSQLLNAADRLSLKELMS